MIKISGDTNAYYRFHAKIYDCSRWLFLFGRDGLIEDIVLKKPRRVLEVGCGTGRNLLRLKKSLPEAELYGVDASPEMLSRAKRKDVDESVEWIEGYFSEDLVKKKFTNLHFDLIFFSYSLSMFNPGWQSSLQLARKLLASQGSLMILDFHDTNWALFEKWMAFNHVRMEGQLCRYLHDQCSLGSVKKSIAYGGVWRYVRIIL